MRARIGLFLRYRVRSAAEYEHSLLLFRYNDIRAFDATRVKLKVINDDENSDYINANFIRVRSQSRLFTAFSAVSCSNR